MKWDLAAYRENIPYLTRYLSTLMEGIGRPERRVATARYIEGLLLPGRRKFIRPLAERLQVDPQSLHQAIANSHWDDHLVWRRIRESVASSLEPVDRWVVNERACLKQGKASVGVSNQRCGVDGKKLRYQISLEILAGNGAFAAPLAARLFLPTEWAAEASRLSRSGVPSNLCFGSKSALALALLQELTQDGLSPKPVVADSSYGNDTDFRSGLLHAGIEFFLEVDPKLSMAWDFQADPPQWNSSLQPHPYTLDKIVRNIPPAAWTCCSWTTGDGILRNTRLGVREVFMDTGDLKMASRLQRLWLVVDWPDHQAQPYRCYLAYFDKRPSSATLLRLSRNRSYLDQYQQCMERDLDLACYQGRSWQGFHHHLVLAAAAYHFVLNANLRTTSAFWSDFADDSAIDPAIAQETTRLASVLFRSGTAELQPNRDSDRIRTPLRAVPVQAQGWPN
jgi:SRSO17 transposase